ncbi:MAG: LexA family protein [Candidatus Saccharimonadales bacterium]
MSEKLTDPSKMLRPTKKQRQLLTYIEQFITEHGYSPSYREIMTGLNYTSVATVALHVNNLISRGHLKKRGYSARSIELTNQVGELLVTTNQVEPAEEKWLVQKVEHSFRQVEQSGGLFSDSQLNGLYILVGALNVLGLEAAAQSFQSRLSVLKKRSTDRRPA